MTLRRCGAALAAVLVSATVAACATRSHPHGSTFCGVHLNTGAESVLFEPLDPTVPAPIAEPPSSRLPPPATRPELNQADYARTSADCDHGAVVAVDPVDAARLTVVIRAGDGTITGVGLQQITAPLTVSAWMSGRYVGSLAWYPNANPPSSIR